MKPALSVCFAVLLLPGCTITRSSNPKSDDGGNFYADIENKSIDSSCSGDRLGSQECAQLSEKQGRVCMTLAQREAVPDSVCPPTTDTARRRFQCAVTDLDPARLGQWFPSDQLIELREAHARALYCGAVVKARSDGLPDMRKAALELESPALPLSPTREQLAAAAELYVADSEEVEDAERCSAALRALARADRGLRATPDDTIKQELQVAQERASAVVSRQSGCPTVPQARRT